MKSEREIAYCLWVKAIPTLCLSNRDGAVALTFSFESSIPRKVAGSSRPKANFQVFATTVSCRPKAEVEEL